MLKSDLTAWLHQVKVFLICLLGTRRTLVLNVATKVLQKGLGWDRLIMLCLVFLILDICSRAEIMEVCWYVDSVLLKSDVENVLVPFFVCVCLSFLHWQGTLTIWVQLWSIRQNFWVVCRGEWVGECVCFHFGFCLILLLKVNSYTETYFSVVCGKKGSNLHRIIKLTANLIT